MKILFVTNNYPTPKHPYFGIFVQEQRQSMLNRGHSVDVLFMNSREERLRAYLNGLLQLLRKDLGEYDVIHTHHSFSALVFMCARPFYRGALVHSYQNDPEHELGKWKLLHSCIYLLFDRIINKSVTDFNSRKKVVHLPNGVDTSVFYLKDKTQSRKALGLNQSYTYLLFVDSYKRRSQKRRDRFEEVLELVKREIESVEPLLAIGVHRSDMPLYMSACDLHVICSDFEGSPNSVKEAIASGTKVVSTPVGDVPSAYRDVPLVKVADNFDCVHLAELIIESLNHDVAFNESLIERLDLSLEQVALKLEKLYEEVLFKR